MRRTLAIFAMLLLLLLPLMVLLPMLAQAQSITYGTACGAPGTGYSNATGQPVTLDAAGAYGLRVDPSTGKWRACTAADVVKPRRIPSGCTLPSEVVWRSGDRVCRGAGITIAHGRIGSVVSGPHRGVYVAQCSDGQVTPVVQICDERRDCEGASAMSDDGATKWIWSGRLQDGERGTAAADDGRTRPVVCRAGVLGLL